MDKKQFLIIISLIAILFISIPVKAENIIYDTLTTSNYKTFRINDDINYKVLNEYSYDVYINDSYLGTYKKDDLIYYPDNSNISIYLPKGIQTDIKSVNEFVMPSIVIIISFLFGFGILIIVVLWVISKIWRR
jgi:hypothetical protein